MAEIEKVLFKRSDDIENNSPKLPLSSDLQYGEIALNYADEHETLSLKNNNDEIVTFSADNVLDGRYASLTIITSLSGSVIGLSGSTMGMTLDEVIDGTNRKLSDYATSANVTTLSASTTGINATLTAHTGNTGIHLPVVTASDNGKVLQVVNGVWTLVTPVTVYTGSNTPSDSLGNNGDIYIQV